jgi:hypothetical protein
MEQQAAVKIAASLACAALLAAACGSPAAAPTAVAGTSAPPSSAASHSVQAGPMPVSPTAAVIADRMKAAGMPVTHLIVYTAVTDPNHLLGRQNGYSSKVAWTDPRAARQDVGDQRGSIGLGGGIEVFPTVAGAYARYTELKGFTAPVGDGYDYLASGTAILRLSQYLTPAQAHAYEQAFNRSNR